MKSFKLPIGLVTYTVKFRKRLVWKGSDLEGLCDPAKKIIWIERRDDTNVMRQTFWHEYSHALFSELGQDDLAYNEAFIESFGQNLARAGATLPKEFK
jgi:hypothetical protein